MKNVRGNLAVPKLLGIAVAVALLVSGRLKMTKISAIVLAAALIFPWGTAEAAKLVDCTSNGNIVRTLNTSGNCTP
jgi:hypothetical protein